MSKENFLSGSLGVLEASQIDHVLIIYADGRRVVTVNLTDLAYVLATLRENGMPFRFILPATSDTKLLMDILF